MSRNKIKFSKRHYGTISECQVKYILYVKLDFAQEGSEPTLMLEPQRFLDFYYFLIGKLETCFFSSASSPSPYIIFKDLKPHLVGFF